MLVSSSRAVSVSIPSRASACSTTSLTAGSSSTTSILVIRNLRQLYLDDGPLPLLGPQLDLSPHPLDQLLADGQAQPEAPRIATVVEALEEVGYVLLAYARTFVLHEDAGTCGPQPDAPALLRVLERVAHQHEQRLLEPLFVGPHACSIPLDGQFQVRAVGERPHAFGN